MYVAFRFWHKPIALSILVAINEVGLVLAFDFRINF